MIGGRHYADRFLTYKRYLTARFQDRGLTKVEAEREAVAYIDRLKGKQFPATTELFEMRDDIALWRASNRKRQRREAARTRWAKEKSRKAIDMPKSRQK